MEDFIGIYDNALTPDQCRAVIARFDASPKVVQGRTGNGVDLTKKDSYDLAISAPRRCTLEGRAGPSRPVSI